MPELPEVQTVVTDLNEKIKGDTVVDFWSEWGKAIKGKSIASFIKDIKSREIIGARRIGKNIFIDLSGGKTLYIHLKMTGHLLIKERANLKSPIPNLQKNSKSQNPKTKNQDLENKSFFDDRVNQYIRHKWFLKSGKILEFSDLRKFGKIVLDSTEKINSLKEIKTLGIDAVSKDFTLKKFQEILARKPAAKIGILLMDQNLIAGIGNIYRSEILFEAAILPERKIAGLKAEEIKKIYKNIKKILEKAIRLRGTSDSDYRDTSGAPGGFQKVLKVYNRENKKCKRCGGKIIRQTLGQRSVFICEGCQK